MKRYVDWFLLGLRTLWHDMIRCDLFKHASAMAYVTLLSIVPSLAAIFSLISVFSPLLGEEGGVLLQIKSFILSNLASGSGAQAITYIESLIQNLNVTQIGLTGLAGILVSLILLLKQIEEALNRIWMVKKERNIFTRFIYFWTFVTLGTFIIGLAFGTITGFNFEQYLPGDQVVKIDKPFIQLFAPKLATLAFFIMLYKVVPNTNVPLKHATIGALPAAILFIIASNSYGSFTSRFTNYQAIYGALAAIPLFLLWLYILWIITLMGALISWRSTQGFTFKDEADEEVNLTPVEKFRNIQLQAITPVVVLSMIYQRFADADGEGANGQIIANQTNLPTNWILESLSILESKRYIVRSQNESEEGIDDSLLAQYFPTIPPEKLNVEKFMTDLSQASDEWIKEWEKDQTVELKKLLHTVNDQSKPKLPNQNFANFLSEMSQT